MLECAVVQVQRKFILKGESLKRSKLHRLREEEQAGAELYQAQAQLG